jgi:hypothetical protein
MQTLSDAGTSASAGRLSLALLGHRKRQHRSQGAAEAAIRSLIKRGLHRPEDGALNSYHCPRCLRWHVGHRREDRR